jgi:hypothetical protein
MIKFEFESTDTFKLADGTIVLRCKPIVSTEDFHQLAKDVVDTVVKIDGEPILVKRAEPFMDSDLFGMQGAIGIVGDCMREDNDQSQENQ